MKKNAKQLAAILAALLCLTGCAAQKTESPESTAVSVEAETEAAEAAEGTVNEDYYEAVNGEFLKNKEIPADAGEWSQFYDLDLKNEEKITELLNEVLAGKERTEVGSKEQKIADFYESVLDKEGRKKAGLGKLASYMEQIKNAATVQEYMEVLAAIDHEMGIGSLFAVQGMVDLADSSKNAWYIGTADLGPGKEVFEDATQEELLKKYQAYITAMMEISGMEKAEAETAAKEVFDFQKELAGASLSLSESGSPDKIYNLYTTEELNELLSNVDIVPVLEKMGVADRGNYIVMDVENEKKINSYLKEENLDLLKKYSIYCLMNDFSVFIAPEAEDAALEWSKARTGAKESRSDEKRAYDLVNGMFGFELGKLYTDKYFTESDKEAVKSIILSVKEVYEDRLTNLDWMGEDTKKAAIKKLETMDLKIGYPEEWPDYYKDSKVVSVSEGGVLIDNILSLMKGVQAEHLRKYSTDEVNRKEWEMTPQTVNAYYNPSMNEIVFPAGILQAPFYSSEASVEENLGGIGTVIAHEISHAFDNNGALYDEKGNYADWWTEKDKEEFEKRTKAVAEYYDGFEVLEGRFVNGTQTLGENIADLAAVSCVSEIVSKDFAGKEGSKEEAEKLQKLYTSYAKLWALKSTEESTVNRLNIDVHSPGKVRVNAVLGATDGFYIAYPEIKEGDAMYQAPEKRVKIW